MPRIKCTHCGADDHVSWDCRKKSTAAEKVPITNGDRSVDAPVSNKRSAAGSGLIQIGGGDVREKQTAIAGTQAPPVEPKIYKDTRKGSRHTPGYMVQYMRDWRKGMRRT